MKFLLSFLQMFADRRQTRLNANSRATGASMNPYLKLATTSEIPAGGKKLIELDGRPIALFNVDGSYYAIDDVCTHDGGPLADGLLIGCEIHCPRHGARFDVRTGKALSMPAFEPVSTHHVEVRGDEIFVSLKD